MSEIRLDRLSLPKVKKTKEGYYKGEAYVTRTGVFKYKNMDGSERLELRHPDEVFKKDSLETLKSIPITNDHPNSLVNADTAADVLIGMTGETIKIDNNYVISSLNITHKDGIKAIEKGRKELSLGYTLDLIAEDGIYEGQVYTHIQKNIKYNHLSLVDSGRAGSSASINFDGALISHDQISNKSLINMEEDTEKLSSRIDKLEEDKKYLQTRLDKSDAIIDQLKNENAQLKSINTDSLIAEKANARFELLLKASKVVNLDSIRSKNDKEIMEAVIKSKDSSIDLTGKSEAYIQGRFDAIVDSLTDSEAIKVQLAHTMPRTDSIKQNPTILEVLKSQNISNNKRRA